MKQVSKVIKNGVTYYFADSALTQSVDNIVDTLNNLSIPDSTSDLINDSGFLDSSDFKTINNQSIVGSGNIDIQGGGGGGISVVEISQTDYDALPTSAKTDTSKIYVISGATSNYYTKSEVDALIPTATSDLTNDSNFVASTNLKTINNSSLVGSGNIVVPTFTYDSTTQTLNITTS